MLEIGFNPGHSALLALSMNPEIHYTGIDWFRNATAICLLTALLFGSRFEIIQGGSREIQPRITQGARPDDLYHVDGGHGSLNCFADVSNSFRLASGRRPCHLLLDDAGSGLRERVYSLRSSKFRGRIRQTC